MLWEILDTGIANAETNMQTDVVLLERLVSNSRPILHFYEWERKSATFGYFLKPEEFLCLENLEKLDLDLARRPTGGGIVFHIWDMAFSVLVPSGASFFSENTLENYAFVNRVVLSSVKEFLQVSWTLIPEDAAAFDLSCERFCMARPTKYDVIYQGRKVAGAAQRKRKQGYLHQGTIALTLPDSQFLERILKPGSRVFEAMQTYTFPLLGANATEQELKDAKHTLRQLLQKKFEES
jgi:lipoate-protein ligase A